MAALDELYFHGNYAEVLASLLSFPYAYNLSKRELYEKVIHDVMEGKAGNIHPEVYQAYSDNLRKAVGGVFRSDDYGDKYFDLQAQLQSNVSRFAAYKAYHLTEQLKKQREKWPDDGDFKNIAKAVLNTFNRYQAAEYNTATARARTAKQWTDFNADPIANELYPNLRWLPSRSASPREEHQAFYWLVLPKTDLFWRQNQPGNLWNCKCDWEETDAPIDTKELKADDLAKARSEGGGIHANGLEGNPAVTGEIFTKECTYFKQAGKNRKQRKQADIEIADKIRPLLEAELKEKLLNKESVCNINGEEHKVMFISQGISEAAQSMKGTYSYWVKNEILPMISEYIQKGHLISITESDTTHNTRKQTIKLKERTDYFYYFETILPNGEKAYINVGHFKPDHPNPLKANKYYFYTITKNCPSYKEKRNS